MGILTKQKETEGFMVKKKSKDGRKGNSGRKPLKASKRRSLRLVLKVNASERARIRRDARSSGLSVAVYMRKTLIGESL